METMLTLPSLDVFIMGAARAGAYSLRHTNNWIVHHGLGHTSIETARNPIFDIASDIATTRISYDKSCKVFLNCNKRRNSRGRDGSKAGTNFGVGVCEKNQGYEVCEPLGTYTTVFQTEYYYLWAVLQGTATLGNI